MPTVRCTRHARASAAGVPLAICLAGCGGGEQPTSPAEQPTSTADAADGQDGDSRTGGSLTQTQPLTGEPFNGDLPAHPVVTVKIDNTAAAAPQVGLGAADLVTEELVEGGLTRLAAMYYSEVPDLVGPVRSTRACDIGIVAPVDAALVASGGAPVTLRRLEEAGVDVYAEGDPGFTRADDRTAPYDVMNELPALVDELAETEPPAPYLPFGAAAVQDARRATGFDVRFSAGHTTSWRFDGDGYARRGDIAPEGDDFVADTVLALDVEIGDAGYDDPAGNPVPETIYEGTGPAMVFHDGTVVEGTWTKTSLAAALELEADGDPFTVPPGNTWIELVPRKDGGVRLG